MANLALAAGGALGEVDRFLSPTTSASSDASTWQAGWVEAALHQEQLADFDVATRFAACAGRRSFRASVYHAISESFTPPGPLKDERYSAALHAFATAHEYPSLPIERVETPVSGGIMPAILGFGTAPRDRTRPVVMAIGGPDLTKELVYCLLADGFTRAGVELLAIELPGSGEALRLGGLLRKQAQRSSSAQRSTISTREPTGVRCDRDPGFRSRRLR
jgi:hypothetical protein